MKFAGYERVRQDNCQISAGEHCSLEFQGYMEGAAEEGWWAADGSRRHRGRRDALSAAA